MLSPSLLRGVALAGLTLGLIGPVPARAGLILQVSVNTAALNGQDGNLDIQFNPGGSGSEVATATVTNFQSIGGVLSQPAALTGDATGSLPGPLMLDNGTAYNDVFQGFTYGTSFSFQLILSGTALDSPGGTFGSAFALSLYDAAGVTPLLTTDPNGSVLTINVNADGTTSVFTFPQSSTNNNPVVIVNSVVPEPSSMVLLGTSVPIICLIALCRRRPSTTSYDTRHREAKDC